MPKHPRHKISSFHSQVVPSLPQSEHTSHARHPYRTSAMTHIKTAGNCQRSLVFELHFKNLHLSYSSGGLLPQATAREPPTASAITDADGDVRPSIRRTR